MRSARLASNDDQVVVGAESKGSPGGDCLDGLAWLCLEEPLADRDLIDSTSGALIQLGEPAASSAQCD
jgi:hypothetical protein